MAHGLGFGLPDFRVLLAGSFESRFPARHFQLHPLRLCWAFGLSLHFAFCRQAAVAFIALLRQGFGTASRLLLIALQALSWAAGFFILEAPAIVLVSRSREREPKCFN